MAQLIRWSPTREMVSLRQAMDRLFEDAFVGGWSDQNGGRLTARLPIDAYSTDNEIVVKAAVPGVKPEDVEITVEGDNLTIKGQAEAETKEENANYFFAERHHGEFTRTLQLNVPVDVDAIKATFEDGVLTVVLPKAEEVRPKVIKVQAKK